MSSPLVKPLFILEMANNHMGELDHGITMIREFRKVCQDFPFDFAFKLQYRDLETYIHPNLKDRMDLKYIKRFSETKLTRNQFDLLVAEMRDQGFKVIVTPFDEVSVLVIEEQKCDYIKIASCAFTDWPLLEKIAQTNLPIIASTAGATIDDIDRVISFLTHRQKSFSILHCVGEYPTKDEDAQLSQIDFLRSRYPEVRIGFSTHENPFNVDNIKIAIAKGATIFEKHVALQTDKYKPNEYSATPVQVKTWLESAQRALSLCGNNPDRHIINHKEADSLHALRRGVYLKRTVPAETNLTREDVYFAFPPEKGQFTANDWSKYSSFKMSVEAKEGQPVSIQNCTKKDMRQKIWEIAQNVKSLLKDSKVVLPGRMDMEISHHYGLEEFEKTGITMLTVVNRGYCKKLIVVLPGQSHPEQFHKQKDETFHVLHGEIKLVLDGVERSLKSGEVMTIEPGTRHAFSSIKGAVIEELSSTHHKNDSFYTDEIINHNKDRKTLLSYWMD